MTGPAPVRSRTSPEEDVPHAAREAAGTESDLLGVTRREAFPDLPGEKLMGLRRGFVAGATAISVGPGGEIMPFGLGFRRRTQESRRITHK